MVNQGMQRADIKRDVLELCSEDICGSWELWWGDQKKLPEQNEELQKEFVDVVETLVKEEHISVFHYGPWAILNAVRSSAEFNRERLEYEINHSLKETGLDPDTFYWFEITDLGQKELEQIWKEESFSHI